MGLVLSLILMLTYYIVFVLGTKLATNAQFSPFLGVWIGNIAFSILGIFMLARSDYEGENRMLARLAASRDWTSSDRDIALKSKRKSVSQWAYSLTHHPKFFRLLDIYVLRGFWFFFGLVLVVFVALFIVITLFALLPDIVKNNIDSRVSSSTTSCSIAPRSCTGLFH